MIDCFLLVNATTWNKQDLFSFFLVTSVPSYSKVNWSITRLWSIKLWFVRILPRSKLIIRIWSQYLDRENL